MEKKCENCEHRTEMFDKYDGRLLLCLAEPYEEDEGVITWLDVANFDASHCLNFRGGGEKNEA